MNLREKLRAALGEGGAPGLIERFERESKRLDVVCRSDGDVQVQLHLSGQQGSPFEQLFVIPQGSEEEAASDISSFVTAFLDEELILIVDGRLVRGGRRWLRPDELRGAKGTVLVVSWRGTFDRASAQR